jgi:psp operon transcriptional activator
MLDVPTPVGQSKAFLDVLEHLSRVAPVMRPVLVIGERGTGKELAAARLHFLSRAWEGPLVKLNCAAIPENLIEAELFGVEAGAFTGAVRRRAGRFEAADNGSLFLDEVANAPASVQEKILRVIEYGEFERVGGTETIKVTVRVVAATNADLPTLARAGRFREDLLDRLAFDVVTLPPLRARAGDVALLADHFGRAMARELGHAGFAGFTADALARLEAHDWPGNVRELRNVVERAVARAEPGLPVNAIVLDPFASPWRASGDPPTVPVAPPAGAAMPPAIPAGPVDLKAELDALERRLVSEAMATTRHNRRAAAARLGLTYDQLRAIQRRHDGGTTPRDV